MKISVVKFEQLTGDEIADWSAIQRAEPLLASPYFRPEFTQAVSEFRSEVEVAVLEDAGQPVGFFPYERRRRNRGMPVGTMLSDYHGLIAQSDVDIDPIELVRGCGLSSWSFNHLCCPNPSFRKYALCYADSPQIDLSQGFDTYVATIRAESASRMRELGRKRRKLEREHGPLRFVPDVRDESLFAKLVDWKVQQYERTKTLNVFGFPWVRGLLERLLEFRSPEFCAVMPVLYAGDEVVAIECSLRCRGMLHGWFRVYKHELHRSSPGSHMLMEICRTAPAMGITCVDLGKGSEEYKRSYSTRVQPVAEGAVDLSALRTSVRSAWQTLRRGVRSTPLRKLTRHPGRIMYKVRGWLALH